ncbi:hypothetical protein ACXKGW_28600 [Klebsiella pneumoniae subsp. pneumoniae]
MHGVTTDRARAEGAPYADGYKQIRDELERVWAEGRIIAAFNGSFDFTIIDREGQRLGYPKLVCGPIVDPYVVDKAVDKYRKGKRTLSVTCEVYGIRLDNAHSADADALAAARLAWKLGNQYDGLASFTIEEMMEKQEAWVSRPTGRPRPLLRANRQRLLRRQHRMAHPRCSMTAPTDPGPILIELPDLEQGTDEWQTSVEESSRHLSSAS